MKTDMRVRGAAHRAHELIVARPHLDLVLDRLGALGVGPVRDPEVSEPLGLALVALAGADPGEKDRTASDGGGSPMDDVLTDLRGYFRREYDGWVPAMGKNREVETVGGTHVISGGGEAGRLPVAGVRSAEALTGGWSGRRLADDAFVLPEPGSGPGGRRELRGRLERPTGELGEGASVAVCDTAIWPDATLSGAYLAAPDALLDRPGVDGLPFMAGHATFITGTVLRNAPGAAVTVHATLDVRARGTSWQFAKDLVELAGRDVDVLNVSAGFFTGDDQPSLAVTTALRHIGPRTVVVAAAGNHGQDEDAPRRPMWPAAYDEVVAVGALTPGGEPAVFSPDAPWVDLLAPGVNVVGNYFDGSVAVTDPEVPRASRRYAGVAAWSGTSFAAAWASGLLAARIRPGEADGRAALRRLVHDANAGTVSALLPKHRA